MKLVQLNLWCGRLENQIRDFIKVEDPDILCLQEAISFAKEDAGFFVTAENIQEIIGPSFIAMAPVVSIGWMRSNIQWGNCIISRFPIKKSETIFTNLDFANDFDFATDNYNVRNFIHANVDIGGISYNVLTHHDYHVPDNKNGNAETLRQMKKISEYIDKLDGPIILTGDFNLAPHSESLEVINGRLNNLSISHNLKTTRTNLTHKTEVCDYIFVSDDTKVKDFHASDEVVSDHKALIMEIDV